MKGLCSKSAKEHLEIILKQDWSDSREYIKQLNIFNCNCVDWVMPNYYENEKIRNMELIRDSLRCVNFDFFQEEPLIEEKETESVGWPGVEDFLEVATEEDFKDINAIADVHPEYIIWYFCTCMEQKLGRCDILFNGLRAIREKEA